VQPRPSLALPVKRTLPQVPVSYFAPSTNWDDEAWWSRQLGSAAGSAA